MNTNVYLTYIINLVAQHIFLCKHGALCSLFCNFALSKQDKTYITLYYGRYKED